MKPKETLNLPRCSKCGGKLFASTHKNGGRNMWLEHIVIRCEQCGDWYGGRTKKGKKEEIK